MIAQVVRSTIHEDVHACVDVLRRAAMRPDFAWVRLSLQLAFPVYSYVMHAHTDMLRYVTTLKMRLHERFH